MGKLLLILVIMIGVVAIAQMMKVYEISSKLRGKKEEEISHGDNVFNANMMLIFMISFYAFFFWLLANYGDGGLGPSGSVHGDTLDWLLNFNFLIVILVFFVTNSLLFVFAFKYYYRPGRKAYWFPHSNKLELLWTSVPALALAIIIILGLQAWNDITGKSDKKSVVVEVYSKQFDWTARYSGADNKLGKADFRMINSENPLGVLTKAGMTKRKDEIRGEIVDLVIKYYKHERCPSFLEKVNRGILEASTEGADKNMFLDKMDNAIKEIDENAEKNILAAYEVMSTKQANAVYDKIQTLQRHLIKLTALEKTITDKDDQRAMDDAVTKELILVKGQEYEFKFRSMDVIHSAYFPHFRAQMNTVPGMVTRFKFVPKYTTTEMRKLMNNDKFDYVLLCNKICGAAHSNMQMKITVVENVDEYNKWLAGQKTVKSVLFPESAAPAPAPEAAVSDSTKTDSTATAAVPAPVK